MIERQNKPRGKLWMTRADHIKVGSSPPIDPKFGDDVIRGDTLSDTELAECYANDLKGVREILELPAHQGEILKYQIETFPSDLDYYRSRGIDVSEGEKLMGINPTSNK